MAKKYKYRKHYTYKGTHIWAVGDTLKELTDCMRKKERAIDEGERKDFEHRTFRTYAFYCLETYKPNITDATRDMLRHSINRASTVIGPKPLPSITVRDCQEVLNEMKGMSVSYISKVRQALRFVFRCAVREGILSTSPAEDLIAPSGTRSHFRALTPEEREHVIKVASAERFCPDGSPDRRFYIFLLMLLCGCRPQEAAECRGSDIKKIEGKHMLHIRGTKTARSDRFVPLPDSLYQLVKNVPLEAYLAPTREGNKQTRDKLRRTWKNFRRLLNISMGAPMYRNAIIHEVVAQDLVPYCLRHEYCTECARRGIDIRTAQRLMGHATIRMTADIYTNLDVSDLISSAEALFI